MKKNQIKNLVVAAMCVALGVILPISLHAIPNAGRVLLPMHIPVLLCGLACGWPYGLACGIMAPLLSAVITGMPPAAILPSMICELAAYGLLSGLFRQKLHAKNHVAELYVQLVAAMLVGRVVYGLMNALVFSAGSYTFALFFAGAFVTALPGIVVQLLLLPAVILLLEKAKMLERSPIAGNCPRSRKL